MKYTIRVCRSVGTNVYNSLHCHTYEDEHEYICAVNVLINAFIETKMYKSVTTKTDDQFTKTYIEIK
jgi:hypothetical protein